MSNQRETWRALLQELRDAAEFDEFLHPAEAHIAGTDGTQIDPLPAVLGRSGARERLACMAGELLPAEQRLHGGVDPLDVRAVLDRRDGGYWRRRRSFAACLAEMLRRLDAGYSARPPVAETMFVGVPPPVSKVDASAVGDAAATAVHAEGAGVSSAEPPIAVTTFAGGPPPVSEVDAAAAGDAAAAAMRAFGAGMPSALAPATWVLEQLRVLEQVRTPEARQILDTWSPTRGGATVAERSVDSASPNGREPAGPAPAAAAAVAAERTRAELRNESVCQEILKALESGPAKPQNLARRLPRIAVRTINRRLRKLLAAGLIEQPGGPKHPFQLPKRQKRQ